MRNAYPASCLVILSTLLGCSNKEFVDDLESLRDWSITDAALASAPTVNVAGENPRTLNGPSADSVAPAADRLTKAAAVGVVNRVGVLRKAGGATKNVTVADSHLSLLHLRSPTQGQALVETQLFQDVMAASAKAIRGESFRADSSLKPQNVYRFSRVTLHLLDQAGGYGGSVDEAQIKELEAFERGTSASPNVSFDVIAQTYLKAYFGGKFINRRGVKLDKPKLEGGKVDNATIAAMETVLLEAFFDTQFNTDAPVLFENRNEFVPKFLPFPAAPDFLAGFERKPVPHYFTQDNAEPSALKFVGSRELIVPPLWDPANPDPDPADIGVSADEYELIRSLSSIGGEVKKQISALVFRIFGGVEFSFVFGGHFSIGNNETLATMVTTLIEVAAARSMELKWTVFFNEFRYHRRTVSDASGGGTRDEPFLTPKDLAKNAEAPLNLDENVQRGVLLLVRYHHLLSKLAGG
jgi:hypothetical protein